MRELATAFVALAVEAARVGDLDTLERALGAGVSVESKSPRGDSLLTLASSHGHRPLVRALLARGANPNVRDAKGQTVLSGAAFKGFVDVAEALVEGGASINGTGDDGRTPLMMASAFNQTEMVRWLRARGAH
ncbi:MAG TPA: ankyrin repeat domain-containing protein [Vicinamibacterales bacterium]|nr:ankyrin repeat domain-containing protein [Vicinamibacterales bacterium]